MKSTYTIAAELHGPMLKGIIERRLEPLAYELSFTPRWRPIKRLLLVLEIRHLQWMWSKTDGVRI